MVKKIEEVTAIEAAQQLGVDPGYLYLQLRAGRIAARKAGKRWLIPAEAIEKRKQARRGQDNGAADLQR